jgi:prepilin-type N-terminal cleavage/methylation domain-containing protein
MKCGSGSYLQLGGGIGKARLIVRRRGGLASGNARPTVSRRRGFTLVEVIVVLVILAILAAIAIPALTGYIDKARYASFKAEVREFMTAAQTVFSEAYANHEIALNSSGGGDSLYVDGYEMAYVNDNLNEAAGYIHDFPSDSMLLQFILTGADSSIQLDEFYTGDSYAPLGDSRNFYQRMWQLTKIPVYQQNEYVGIDAPTIFLNDKFQIIAFLYIDIDSIDESGNGEVVYTYGLDLGYDDKSGYIYNYDQNAGYRLYQIDYSTSTVTEI